MAVFRRDGGIGDEVIWSPACGTSDIEGKMGCALERTVKPADKLGRPPRETGVIPKLGHQPGAARRPDAPIGAVDRAGGAPDISIVVHHPAAGAVVGSRHFSAGDGQFLGHLQDRLHHVGEVGRIGQPVVHLQVYIGGIFAAPGPRPLFQMPRRVDGCVPGRLEEIIR